MALPFFYTSATMTAPVATPRSWFKPAALGAAVLALAAIGYGAWSHTPAAPQVTFISIEGEKISTADLRGKVVLVNFWATSCTTCVAEMPDLINTYQRYQGRGLELVAVAMQYDRPDYVLNFTEQRQLPFKVALDTAGELARQFGDVTLTPTTFLIDRQGRILKRYVGMPDFDAMHKLIEQELAG